ncbi:archease [Halorubrum aethiopicum]|uniref:archease n=1 Tax=Halorubrum aethiopicum TaxID=1758255 RepID=UPI00082B5C99|nr:archease [Halorubrum aethiopicum]
MTYELRDHTADVAVEATAPTLSALFAAVADGLTAASCESVPPAVGERFALRETAESREALLFDYLDRLIYERDVRLVLPADHECRVIEPDGNDDGDTPADGDAPADADVPADGDDPEWTVEASARGVPLDAVVAREVKAVTYSEMALERRDDGWYAYVVFDV